MRSANGCHSPSRRPDRWSIPCRCGHRAGYQEFALPAGADRRGRGYYLSSVLLYPHCNRGQFPADVELDIENTEFSPGVRRLQAVVGQDAPFDQGRQQLKLLADLEVTTKSVERTAEAIGEDIATRTPSHAVGPADHRGRTDSRFVGAGGGDRSACREEGDARPPRARLQENR